MRKMASDVTLQAREIRSLPGAERTVQLVRFLHVLYCGAAVCEAITFGDGVIDVLPSRVTRLENTHAEHALIGDDEVAMKDSGLISKTYVSKKSVACFNFRWKEHQLDMKKSENRYGS